MASGDPRPNSVVLWTFLASPLDVSPLVVTLEVATDDAFAEIVYTRQIEVNEMYDGAVKVVVDGLEPYMTYYYQFTHGDLDEPGRADPDRTLAGNGDRPEVRHRLLFRTGSAGTTTRI